MISVGQWKHQFIEGHSPFMGTKWTRGLHCGAQKDILFGSVGIFMYKVLDLTF